MSNQITGRLLSIGQSVQIPSKSGGQPFTKREFLLDATMHDPYTGQRSEYENILPLELTGDKCPKLDKYQAGDIITVHFALQGREYTASDGQPRRIVSVRCYKLELVRHAAAPQPAYQPSTATAQPVPPPDDLPF